MIEHTQVAKLIQILTKCSPRKATLASERICTDPAAVRVLALACGGATSAVAAGGAATVTALALTPVAWPWAISGMALATAGGLAAKRYCNDMIRSGTGRLDEMLEILDIEDDR